MRRLALPLLTAACVPDAPLPSEATELAPALRSGVVVELHAQASRRFGLPFPPPLDELSELGARQVTLPIPWHVPDLSAASVTPGPLTPAPRSVEEVAEEAHARGMEVILLPILVVDDGGPGRWRGALAPRNEARFWWSYQAFIARIAEQATRVDAALLYIGSELSSLTGPRQRERWRGVAAAARARFRGPLGYAANHDALERLAPAPFVDVLGVSAWFSLGDALDASPSALRRAWRGIARRLGALADRAGRPLVLTEVGCPSVDGAATSPWRADLGGPVDLEEQRRVYAAIAAALDEEPRIRAATFWSWFGPGGPHDRGFTPRGKPALEPLRRALRSSSGARGQLIESGPTMGRPHAQAESRSRRP